MVVFFYIYKNRAKLITYVYFSEIYVNIFEDGHTQISSLIK